MNDMKANCVFGKHNVHSATNVCWSHQECKFQCYLCLLWGIKSVRFSSKTKKKNQERFSVIYTELATMHKFHQLVWTKHVENDAAWKGEDMKFSGVSKKYQREFSKETNKKQCGISRDIGVLA